MEAPVPVPDCYSQGEDSLFPSFLKQLEKMELLITNVEANLSLVTWQCMRRKLANTSRLTITNAQ